MAAPRQHVKQGHDANYGERTQKPCRSCTDFKSWRAQMQNNSSPTQNTTTAAPGAETATSDRITLTDCPLDKDQLGRNTWSFLHTMAAHYPDTPTSTERDQMKTFVRLFGEFYPCKPCADSLKDELRSNPPDTSSQSNLSQWMCRLHNSVNVRLGKPAFDCSWVNERWRDGWKDGSCD